MAKPVLPWALERPPLMLAPMQGLTNRGLRDLFARWVRPDVLFTEFVRIRPGARQPISNNDRLEALHSASGIPLVVQLIGEASEHTVEAARMLEDLGVTHINLNMGCPFGRMSACLAGGGMFKDSAPVPGFLAKLRAVVSGSLSVKARTGYDDPRQIFGLLPIFEECGVDFLVVHARTVVQRYEGAADHRITAEIVASTRLPVIANGDIVDAASARRALELTSAAGLMLGRGAIADPLLFERIRGNAPEHPSAAERLTQARRYVDGLIVRYRDIFFGDAQVLTKLKESIWHIDDPSLHDWLTSLRRAKRLDQFTERVHAGCV